MLRELIEHFSEVEELPIEIDDIVAKIMDLGFQDEIFLFGADTDPTQVRGAFHQFTYRDGVYADPRLVTHIVYSQRVSLPWQRVICAKELVHIFDPLAAKTDTEEEASLLLDRLVGPLSSEDYGMVDLQAAKDRLALYQALPLLLPHKALTIARDAVQADRATVEQVATWACLPAEFVRLMLSDDWRELNGVLSDL
ncbi:hypothetical protein [Roseicyclus amphidinii]|uniref:hypothetical protein n=1 Tax=Roseicyclus amphidinii TaxID=3034232 RepID=UPI0024E14158|nr:hypothetical protein [Roseicyclus sp. Amp-Y-6]